MKSPNAFLDNFIDSEYKLYHLIHTTKDDSKVEKALDDFDKKFYYGDLYSSISRQSNMTDEEFSEYEKLLATRQKRHIFCITEETTGVWQAVLGAIDEGTSYKFELARVKLLDDEWKIVSTYYTNFDDTFSYAGGESIGEIIEDPCSE